MFFDPTIDANGKKDREYNAQGFTDYFKSLVTTGLMKRAGNELKVTANGSNMITEIDTGIAFIEGRFYENDSKLSLTHDTETLGKSRIDRIVVRMDLNTESRFVKSFIKKGVPAVVPVAPALQRDQFIYEISLAQVKIIGGQTYINANDVIDERGKTDICPWAGSKILPNFDNATLEEHIHDYKEHIPYAVATRYDTKGKYNITLDGVTQYYEGLALSIKILETNNALGVLININNLGEKYVKKPNGGSISIGSLKPNGIYTLRYNGTDFILQGEGGSGNAQPAQVLVTKTFTNDDGEQVGTMPNRGGIVFYPTSTNIAIPEGYYNGSGYVKAAEMKVSEDYISANNALRTSTTWSRFFTVQFLFTGFIPKGCLIYFTGIYTTINSDRYSGYIPILFRDFVSTTYGEPLYLNRWINGGNTGGTVLQARADFTYGSGVRVVGNRIYADIEVTSSYQQPQFETYSKFACIAWGIPN
mgnify:CR=1 FL=1